MEEHTYNPAPKSTLWASLEKLMLTHWGKKNVTRLAREADMGLATVSRLQANDPATSLGLDKVEKLGAVFGVPPWLLLDPAFDPSADGAKPLSAKAIALARAFDQITDQLQQDRAYAMATQLFEFAAPTQAGTPAPGDEPK